MRNRKLKKKVYITLFTFLGFLLQLLFHAITEIIYIDLLLTRYETFGFGISLNDWWTIHNFYSFFLAIFGIAFGFQQGRYWWARLYESHEEIPNNT